MVEREMSIKLSDRLLTEDYQKFLRLQNSIVEAWKAGRAINSRLFDTKGRPLVNMAEAVALQEFMVKNNIAFSEGSEDFRAAVEYFGLGSEFGGTSSRGSAGDKTLIVHRGPNGEIIETDPQQPSVAVPENLLARVKKIFKK